MPVEGFEVHEIPFRSPRVLEASRRAVKRQERLTQVSEPARDGGSGPGGAANRIIRRLGRLRESRGIFASVRMPDLTHFWIKPAVEWALAQPPWDIVVSSAGPYTAHLVAMAIRPRSSPRGCRSSSRPGRK